MAIVNIALTLEVSEEQADGFDMIAGTGAVMKGAPAASSALLALIASLTMEGWLTRRTDAAGQALRVFAALDPAAQEMLAPAFEGYLVA